MKSVQPMTGAFEVQVGFDQPYEPLVGGAYYHEDAQSPVILTRWKPSDEERERVAAGEDLYLAVLTFGHPLQPVLLTVGPPDWSDREAPQPILPEEIGPEGG